MGKGILMALLLLAGCRNHRPIDELSSAAANNDLHRLNALLDAGADPNARGDHGITPLATAARAGAMDAIALLVRRGADPNLRCGVNGWTPLMHAIHKSQTGSLRALIAAGADVNATGAGCKTPLMMAAGYGYADMISLLTGNGADAAAELPKFRGCAAVAMLTGQKIQ